MLLVSGTAAFISSMALPFELGSSLTRVQGQLKLVAIMLVGNGFEWCLACGTTPLHWACSYARQA